MKKRLVLISVILTLLVGFSQKTFSGDYVKVPTSNYMQINNASYVCDCVDFIFTYGGYNVSVTIYDEYHYPVKSFNVPYSGIFQVWMQGEPAGRYYAIMTGNGIYEVDYFTKVCN